VETAMSQALVRWSSILLIFVLFFSSIFVASLADSRPAGPPPAISANERFVQFRLNHHNYYLQPVHELVYKKSVLLTFDDAPLSKKSLTSILNTLNKYKIKAIFFVNGYLVKNSPDLLKSIHMNGHEIGNHSWNHWDLSRKNKDVVQREIQSVQKQVKDLIGIAPRYFRPPYGAINGTVKAIVTYNHLTLMHWSNDPEDWRFRNKNRKYIPLRVMKYVQPGQIILLHDLPCTSSTLEQTILLLKEQGYAFVAPKHIE
jgi:peptidoglycan/xylan/chitin deacetylase (PgdA/CDA1 family)